MNAIHVAMLAVCGILVFIVIVAAFNETSPIPTDVVPDPIDHSEAASRARYMNAVGSLDRAWGSHNLLLVTRDGRHQVIVGLSETECTALYGVLLEEAADVARQKLSQGAMWVTPCYETVRTAK